MESIYKKSLNPSFWQNEKFNDGIRRKIIKIVSDFLKEIELDAPILDLVLTGSLANFNYNKYSDLDIHIIIDFEKINSDASLVKDMLDGKRFVWNLRHNIFLKGHEVEVYFEDKDEPHISSGIYSILKNSWIKKPVHAPPGDIDMQQLVVKTDFYTNLVNRMHDLLQQSSDKQDFKLIHNKAKRLKDKIIKIRKEALQQKGEFALENLLFKKLRNNNVIEKIINIINLSYDKFFMESLSFNKIVLNFTKE
jgi:predicted nucleotidyltransferase